MIGWFTFLKQLNETDGFLNIKDAYSKRVDLVRFFKLLYYVRLLNWLFLNNFRQTYKLLSQKEELMEWKPRPDVDCKAMLMSSN